jgi:hypothetical protein
LAQELGVVVTLRAADQATGVGVDALGQRGEGVDGRRPPPSSPGFALFALGMSRKVPAELLSLRVDVMA